MDSEELRVLKHQADLDELLEMAEANPGGMSPLFLSLLERVCVRQREELTPECSRCCDQHRELKCEGR